MTVRWLLLQFRVNYIYIVVNYVSQYLVLLTQKLITGEVLKHGDVKCVLNEGMPQYKNPFEKGRMIIQFLVNFPDKLPAQKISQLESCLPARLVALCSG